MAFALLFEIFIRKSKGSDNPLIASKSDASPRDTIKWIPGDHFKLRVHLLDEPEQPQQPFIGAQIDSGNEIVLNGKNPEALTGDSYFSATGFTEVESGGQYYYEADLDLNVEAFITAANEGNGGQANVLAELQVQDAGNTKRLSYEFPVIGKARVYQGTEGVPTSGEPAYPSAAALQALIEGGGSGASLIEVSGSTARLALGSGDMNTGDLVREVGTKQVTQIVCVADVGGSLNGTSFLLAGLGDTAEGQHVFDFGGNITQTNDAAASLVAENVLMAIEAVGLWSVVRAGEILTITDNTNGARANSRDETTGFAITIPVPGVEPGDDYIVIDPSLAPDNEAAFAKMPPRQNRLLSVSCESAQEIASSEGNPPGVWGPVIYDYLHAISPLIGYDTETGIITFLKTGIYKINLSFLFSGYFSGYELADGAFYQVILSKNGAWGSGLLASAANYSPGSLSADQKYVGEQYSFFWAAAAGDTLAIVIIQQGGNSVKLHPYETNRIDVYL